METEVEFAPVEKPFEFTGSASEDFRIWIVNLCLSVLTLGIYSAWAKVRRRPYTYGNTLLDGVGFEYLANPIPILKGRLIAVALLTGYVALVQWVPSAKPVVGILFLILLPWLVVRGLTFNARYSAYRNVRFNFVGAYPEAARVLIGWALLAGFTLVLAYPAFVARRNELVVGNHRYGSLAFHFRCPNDATREALLGQDQAGPFWISSRDRWRGNALSRSPGSDGWTG